jgi:serine/threonine protein kinase
MPPEAFNLQDKNEDLYSTGDDLAHDAWSLGCVLYFCRFGKPRFYGETIQQVIEQLQDYLEGEYIEAVAKVLHYNQNVANASSNTLSPHEHHVQFQSIISSNRVEDPEDKKEIMSGNTHQEVKDTYQEEACDHLMFSLLATKGNFE